MFRLGGKATVADFFLALSDGSHLRFFDDEQILNRRNGQQLLVERSGIPRGFAPNAGNTQGLRQLNQTKYDATANSAHAPVSLQGTRVKRQKIKGEMMAPCAPAISEPNRQIPSVLPDRGDQDEGYFALRVPVNPALKPAKTLGSFITAGIVAPPFCGEPRKFDCFPNRLGGFPSKR